MSSFTTATPLPPTSFLLRTKDALTNVTLSPPTAAEATTTHDVTLTESTLSATPIPTATYSNDGGVLAAKDCAAAGGNVYLASTGTSGTKTPLAGNTSGVQAIAFSPLSTYVVTWEKPPKESGGDGNLKIFATTDGSLLTSYHMKNSPSKGVAWPAVEWSDDEKVGSDEC